MIRELENRDKLIKIKYPLNQNDWHKNSSETLWIESIKSNKGIVRNIPFYIKGIGYGDVVEYSESIEGGYDYKSTIQHRGHSTYRIFLNENIHPETFNVYWTRLEKIGCTFEQATNRFYAIDVPSETDVYAAYRILEQGEIDGVWDFEEGHCGHPV